MQTQSISSVYGHFHGELNVRLAPGGLVELLEDYVYVDPFGTQWVAPKGTLSDGASIPQWAWSFIGGPLDGAYRDAAIIHDVACATREHHWADVHRAFYHAMLASGTPKLKASIMYAAVYYFGPRWDCSSEPNLEPASLYGEFALLVNLLQRYELPLSREAMASAHRRCAPSSTADSAQRRCA